MICLFEYGLIEKMIDLYRQELPNAQKGHIILIMNSLRLAAEVYGDSEVSKRVISNQGWGSFESDLSIETRKQFNQQGELPMPHYSPALLSPVAPQFNTDPYGLGLGSEYAYALGFAPISRYEEGETTDDGTLSSSSNPSPNRKKFSKKKKHKRRDSRRRRRK
jgi:hypothetical protein